MQSTYEAIERQLQRLESNLERYNPNVLKRLRPGLDPYDIQVIEEVYNIELEPELKALYEWRNGFDNKIRDEDECLYYYPYIITGFLDLFLALFEGKRVHPVLYAIPQIVPEELLENRICLFAGSACSLEHGVSHEVSRLWMPFSTRGALDYSLPLHYDPHYSDSVPEFQYDSLEHALDHVNFSYDGKSLREGAIIPESLKDFPDDGRALICRSRDVVVDFHRLNSPYCIEIHRAIYLGDWPNDPPVRRQTTEQ